METRKIEVCDAVKIDVICAYNDRIDIAAGGPPTLGYVFFVDSTTNIDNLKRKIKGWLKRHKRPFLNIKVTVRANFPVDKLWDSEKIEDCIKENYI
jgi:hypothetical protein